MASLKESMKVLNMKEYNAKNTSDIYLSKLIEMNPVFYQIRNKKSDFHASDVPLRNISSARNRKINVDNK